MQIFYVNIGGGEPTIRSDFWELVDYATAHHVGVKFSTNGSRITDEVARRAGRQRLRRRADLARRRHGRRSTTPCAGAGSFATAVTAMERLAAAGFTGFKLSVVVTRHNVPSSTPSRRSPTGTGPSSRLTRLRPSGRGADVWDELHPTAGQQRQLYDWLVAHGEDVLTGDSFFHLAGFGEPLPGLNLCGAGRVVCLVDPVGDVYACPFAIHEEFLAGNVRSPGGFTSVWRDSRPLRRAAQPPERGCLRRRAGTTTPAGAAAWRPSSSPVCRSTAPTPSACSATASTRSAARGDGEPPRPSPDHSVAAPRGRSPSRRPAGPTGRATRAPSPGPRPITRAD